MIKTAYKIPGLMLLLTAAFNCVASEVLLPLQANKLAALAFYSEVLNEGKLGKITQYVADSYQPYLPDHNNLPSLDGGIDALRERLQKVKTVPNEVKRIISDGDYVFAQVKYSGDADVAGVDIFEFNHQGKILNHWQNRQTVPEDVLDSESIFAGGGNADAPMSAEELAINRDIIRTTFEEVWSKGKSELTLDYYAESYQQHNPHIPDGGARIEQIIEKYVKKYIEDNNAPYPMDIHHVGAQGDLVFIHCSITMIGLGRNAGVKTESVDIMRINDENKLAEHWDVLQMETDSLPNHSSLF